MAEQYAFTIRVGDREITTAYSTRDSRFLGGALLPEALPFLSALGKWDNYTVATGMDTGAWTVKPAAPLLATAQALLDRLTEESALFGYDYQYSFPERAPGQKNSGTQTGFKAYDHHCAVNAKTPGQIYLELLFPLDGSAPVKDNVKDIRAEKGVLTSWGPLQVHRRTKPIAWLEKLPPIIAFLRDTRSREVEIRHHYTREKTAT